MITIATSLLSAGFLFLSIHLAKRHLRLVRLGSRWPSFLWSFRVSFFKYSFPRKLEHWATSYASSQQNVATWELLRPFFKSKGYNLYTQKDHYGETFPSLGPCIIHFPWKWIPEPYARTLDVDTKFGFIMGSHYIWAARDAVLCDVVIKVISEVDNPSNEWLLLQKFNHPDLRSDPRNRTIHVIKYITFDNFVFAVMPRWDPAFIAPFSTVAELMDVSKSCLEAMDFLHSHRVAHQDFSLGNTGMNLYGSHSCLTEATGVRHPQDVKYVIYDFGYSLIYPMDTDIDKVESSRKLQYYQVPDPIPPYNPFKSDVTMMGNLLYGHVMHAAKFVPEIEGFFDHMMDLDENKRPTASEALQEFMQIYDNLTAEQLRSPVTSTWTNWFPPKLT